MMSKTVLALVLALSVPAIHAQQANRQSEYSNPPSTKGSSVTRADVKAEERAAGSMGTRQSEYSDTAKRRSGSAAANDGAPTSDPFAKSRDEKAQAKNAYKHEKTKDRAEYKNAKKESVAKLKATNQRSDTEKNMEVPK
jgi:hypothetical protein